MALNAKKATQGGGGGMRQENLEPGGYPARLVQVIDFGVQNQPAFQGKSKPPVQMIGLTYELLDEFMKDEEGNEIEDKPRWVSEIIPLYNLSADRAKSTQRYYALDPKEEKEGDFVALIGTPVTVNIVNNVSKKDPNKVYDNVESLSAMRTKEAKSAPELVNEPRVFELDEPDLETFRTFPEWIQEKIKSNLEYNGSKLQQLIQNGDYEDNDDESDDESETRHSSTDSGEDDDVDW